MPVDIWVSTLFKLGFIVIAVHLTITKIIPMVEGFLSTVFNKNKKVLDSLTSLIGVLILILAGKEILFVIEELNNVVLNYILTLGPSLTVLLDLVFYLQWIIIAVFVVTILKNFKK